MVRYPPLGALGRRRTHNSQQPGPRLPRPPPHRTPHRLGGPYRTRRAPRMDTTSAPRPPTTPPPPPPTQNTIPTTRITTPATGPATPRERRPPHPHPSPPPPPAAPRP